MWQKINTIFVLPLRGRGEGVRAIRGIVQKFGGQPELLCFEFGGKEFFPNRREGECVLLL